MPTLFRPSRVRSLMALAVLGTVLPTRAATGAGGQDFDLGEGLVYRRVRELPAGLPAWPAPRPCVIDVRYVVADAQAAGAFAAWLTFHASPRVPVFVLANAETGGALRAALAGGDTRRAFLVVGLAGLSFQPDLAVRGSADEERRAYDAWDQGVAPAALLAEHPDKIRHDEASLTAEPPPVPEPPAAGEARPAPPIDVALRRAVHVFRALQALKKI